MEKICRDSKTIFPAPYLKSTWIIDPKLTLWSLEKECLTLLSTHFWRLHRDFWPCIVFFKKLSISHPPTLVYFFNAHWALKNCESFKKALLLRIHTLAFLHASRQQQLHICVLHALIINWDGNCLARMLNVFGNENIAVVQTLTNLQLLPCAYTLWQFSYSF